MLHLIKESNLNLMCVVTCASTQEGAAWETAIRVTLHSIIYRISH